MLADNKKVPMTLQENTSPVRSVDGHCMGSIINDASSLPNFVRVGPFDQLGYYGAYITSFISLALWPLLLMILIQYGADGAHLLFWAQQR
jgi:hypothetical protein